MNYRVKKWPLWDRIAWNILFRIGIMSKPNSISKDNLFNLRYYFKSRHRNPKLAKGDVVCIMCTWDEEMMVRLALESSKEFVSRYIVVDKNGSTIQAIKECCICFDVDN